MGQFIVSARKYRPNSFEELIGQENIARTLKNSIMRDQLAHAYLFCGPRGVGKTSAARIFAKTINCSNLSQEMEPCGECESCLSFAQGRSYSIHELDAASNNSVDDIRNLTDQVRIPPQVGRYSVYIIDEVHMLSQAAFNAFLKTLEEPPAHAIFILATTEKHKILPTILSRCQTYDFNRISVENIVRNLKGIAAKEEIAISEDAMHIIAQKADGAMRDALTLFDQTVAFCGKEITYEQVIKNLNVLDYEYYFRLTDFFLKGDFTSALLTFDEILSRGFNAHHFISGLCTHFRDMIVCKNEASHTLIELAPSVTKRYKESASACPLQFLFDALSLATTCDASYKQSGNPRLLIEFTLMKLSRLMQEGTGTETAQKTSVRQENQGGMNPSAETTQPVRTSSPDTAKREMPGLSIKSIMQQATQQQVKTEPASESSERTESREFTVEAVKKAWMELAASEKKRPSLSAAISQTEPVVNIETRTVTFPVKNVAQKEWIEKNCRINLEAFLQNELGDKHVRLVIEESSVTEEEKSKKLIMQSDKAKYLQEISPEFRNLTRDFDLES